MELLIIAVIVVVGIFLFKGSSSKSRRKVEPVSFEQSTLKESPPIPDDKTKKVHPYRKVDLFLSNAERSFFGVLEQAVAGKHLIFSKVRVADVLMPETNPNRSEWQTAFNSISSKHFDYILCTPDDCSVLLAIELDDSSHNLEKTQERDSFIDMVCESAGLPLLRIKASNSYIVPTIREAIDGMIRGEEVNQDDITETPKCPRCGSIMVLRKAKKGSHAGEDFWGCSAYPKCKTMISIGSK